MGSDINSRLHRIAEQLDVDRGAAAKIRVLVPTGYGLNCEAETAAAFAMLGATVEQLHVTDLLAEPGRLAQAQIVAFIGGFSFGDHVASGRIYANRLRFGLGDALARFVADGGLAVGMCNGFQAMVKLGLLPGPLAAVDGDDAAVGLAPQRASVIGNQRLGYRNGWVRMVVDAQSPCVWTRDIAVIESPSRHGEGKLVFADDALRDQLAASHQIPVRYVDAEGQPTEDWPANPNGSPGGAAGLCDRSGRVFGLMPHPEAFLYAENHPRWIAQRDSAAGSGAAGSGFGQGLRLFANGLRAATRVY